MKSVQPERLEISAEELPDLICFTLPPNLLELGKEIVVRLRTKPDDFAIYQVTDIKGNDYTALKTDKSRIV